MLNRAVAGLLASRAWDRRVGILLMCALISVLATGLTGPADGYGYQLSTQLVAATCTVLAGIGAWRHRATLGRIGGLIFAGIAAQWVGSTGQSIDTLFVHSGAFPSWIDVFYLSNYVSTMAAVLLIVRRRRLVRNVAALIDTVTVTVGVAVLAWCFVIADIAGDSSVTTAARLVGALYPVCDVLVFGAMTRLLFSSSMHRGPLLLLTGGMFCLFAGDVGFTLGVFAGADSGYARWIDSLYHFSIMVITFSLWQKDTDRLVDIQERTQARLGTLRKVALAIGALLAPATLVIQNRLGNEEHVLAAATGGVILSALILVRMSLLVTAVESQSEQLVVLARTDSLTGLANRRTFDFELDRAMNPTETEPRSGVLSVGLLDLDHFKQFNDTHGHGRGDQLLRECAAHWSDGLARLAPGAFVARYGGEEFVVIFRGEGTPAAVEILHQIMPATPMEQSFSAGVATWDGAESALELLNRADTCMYAAKSAGRKLVLGEQVPAQTR